MVVRALRAARIGDLTALNYWNAWATAAKETEELRLQSWQMGRTLVRLLLDLREAKLSRRESPVASGLTTSVKDLVEFGGNQCNFAIGFGIAAAHW